MNPLEAEGEPNHCCEVLALQVCRCKSIEITLRRAEHFAYFLIGHPLAGYGIDIGVVITLGIIVGQFGTEEHIRMHFVCQFGGKLGVSEYLFVLEKK